MEFFVLIWRSGQKFSKWIFSDLDLGTEFAMQFAFLIQTTPLTPENLPNIFMQTEKNQQLHKCRITPCITTDFHR